MRLGRFFITQTHTADELILASLSKFIMGNVRILERIVTLDNNGKQCIVILGTSPFFVDMSDDIKNIPTYEIFQETSIISEQGFSWKFKPMEDKDESGKN